MLYCCVQAMDILFSLTDEALFPWHEPPRTPEGAILEADRAVWARMFDLSRTCMIERLVAHKDGTFPGSSALALRIFAFYTSWLRLHFCKDKRLCLSLELLSTLKVAHQFICVYECICVPPLLQHAWPNCPDCSALNAHTSQLGGQLANARFHVCDSISTARRTGALQSILIQRARIWQGSCTRTTPGSGPPSQGTCLS